VPSRVIALSKLQPQCRGRLSGHSPGPGGNLTGINFLNAELGAKRLDLLRQLVPTATRIVLLGTPTGAFADAALRNTEVAARAAPPRPWARHCCGHWPMATTKVRTPTHCYAATREAAMAAFAEGWRRG
jgi:hypothetical protein